MWVARPKLANNNIAMEQAVIDAEEDPLRKRALAKRKHRGKQMHVPVLNLCEQIFVQVASVGPRRRVRAASLHSPAHVLPEANYATVLSR